MANKWKKKKINTNEVWTEEELANYLGFNFIAGFTEGGAPFGIGINEDDDEDDSIKTMDTDEELPF